MSVHLQAPYRQAQKNEDMKRYNKAMSEVRITVEWLLVMPKIILSFVTLKTCKALPKSSWKNIQCLHSTTECTYLPL